MPCGAGGAGAAPFSLDGFVPGMSIAADAASTFTVNFQPNLAGAAGEFRRHGDADTARPAGAAPVAQARATSRTIITAKPTMTANVAGVS